MNKICDIRVLKKIALNIRIDLIRSLNAAGSGHLGGSLGLADVFTLLYCNQLNIKPDNPTWEDRDRLILSIGHVAPVLYTSLAYAGFFEKEELLTLRKLGSRLQGHPGKDFNLPGLESSTGSLGQGLSIAVGMALAAKIDKKNYKIYSIQGDGELQEGQIWEAAMSAYHYQLDNLIAVIDRNYCQIDGFTHKVMNLEPLTHKWKSFGWNVITCDGNDFTELMSAFNMARNNQGSPSVIIAKTIMGKGVKSIENDYKWHGKVPNKEETKLFIKELLEV